MSTTWKIIIVIIITAVIVGGGVYYWQQNESDTSPVETEKTFKGNGFSFTYPVKYIADDNGLWTEDRYQQHINPPYGCDICQVPEIGINSFTTNKTLDEEIIDAAGRRGYGETLEEMKQQTGLSYEKIEIGDNDFVRITISDMMDVTHYFTKYNNQVVDFMVSLEGRDNQELKDIISTLKFE